MCHCTPSSSQNLNTTNFPGDRLLPTVVRNQISDIGSGTSNLYRSISYSALDTNTDKAYRIFRDEGDLAPLNLAPSLNELRDSLLMFVFAMIGSACYGSQISASRHSIRSERSYSRRKSVTLYTPGYPSIIIINVLNILNTALRDCPNATTYLHFFRCKFNPYAMDVSRITADVEAAEVSNFRARKEDESTCERVMSYEPPPNGGWTAWSQVLGGHIITFFSWGFINSFGMFQAYYTSQQLSYPSNISWIGSTMIFLLMMVPLFSGSASDVGHYKTVLRAGVFLYVFGVFMTSICKEYWQFLLAQGLCVGLGMGCMFVPSMSVVSTYFDSRKRSSAIGMILVGSATGGMVFPIMLNKLFDAIGFGWAVRTFGFMALALLIVAERLLKKRLPPKDGAKIIELGEFRDVVFLLFVVGSFLNFIGLYFAYFFINAYARTTFGLTLNDTIPILMVLNGLGIPGRIVPMLFADRLFRPIHVTLPLNLASALLLFVWIAVRSLEGLYVFAVFYGFFAAGLQSLFPATMADLTTDPKRTGTRFGMGFALSSFGVLVGCPVGGLLVEVGKGTYLHAQVFAGGCCVAGFFTVLLAAVLHRKRSSI